MNVVILFIGGVEIFVVLLIALLLFGADKIPEVAKGLGKGLHEFQKATNEIKKEFNNHTGDIVKEGKEIKDDLKKSIDDITDIKVNNDTPKV